TNTLTNTATRTFTATPTLTNTPLPIVCEPVEWANKVNVTASGNTLTKSSGIKSTWDAGASSTRALQSGDGYVEVTVDAIDKYRMFGLSNGDTDISFADIDYGAYLAGSQLQVYEDGAFRGTFGALIVGDVVRVSVESDRVKYYRNGVLVYTS